MSSSDILVEQQGIKETEFVPTTETNLMTTDDSQPDLQSTGEEGSCKDSSQLDDAAGVPRDQTDDTDQMRTSSDDKEASTNGDKDTETETEAEPDDTLPPAKDATAAPADSGDAIEQAENVELSDPMATSLRVARGADAEFDSQAVRATARFGNLATDGTLHEVSQFTTVTQKGVMASEMNQMHAARQQNFISNSGEFSSGQFLHQGASPFGSPPGYDTSTSFEQSRRKVSSVVVSSEFLGPPPQSGNVTYIEIPIVEEVTKRIPKREVVEVEKVVPRYEIEYVERLVDTPRVQYVDRVVEVPQVQEIIKTVPVKKVVDVPREVVVTVPRVTYVTVDKPVEVPGPIIEIEKPYIVERPIETKYWVDKNAPVVVAQTVHPVVTESSEVIDVDVFEYEPRIIPVEVQVAKPVSAHLAAIGVAQEQHQFVSVPAAQYNTILKSLNAHLGAADSSELPYMREGNEVPFLAPHEVPGTAVPVASARLSQAAVASRGVTLTTAGGETVGPTLSATMVGPTVSASIVGSTLSASALAPPTQQPLELKFREASNAGQPAGVSARPSGISHHVSTAAASLKHRSAAGASMQKSAKTDRGSIIPTSTTVQHKKKRACAC